MYHLLVFILVVIVAGVWFSLLNVHMLLPILSQQWLLPKLSRNCQYSIWGWWKYLLCHQYDTHKPTFCHGSCAWTMYFEASFPIELQKADGTVIQKLRGAPQGIGWPKIGYHFTATITFPAQQAQLASSSSKDNPSWLPRERYGSRKSSCAVLIVLYDCWSDTHRIDLEHSLPSQWQAQSQPHHTEPLRTY